MDSINEKILICNIYLKMLSTKRARWIITTIADCLRITDT